MSEHRVIRKLSSSSSPSVKGQHALLYLLGGLLFFKFLWFNFYWCLLSTFRPYGADNLVHSHTARYTARL